MLSDVPDEIAREMVGHVEPIVAIHEVWPMIERYWRDRIAAEEMDNFEGYCVCDDGAYYARDCGVSIHRKLAREAAL